MVLLLPAVLAASLGASPHPSPSPVVADPLQGLSFRFIGPAVMGGRIDDFAVVESRPSTFYVATASGGLWKTINNGVTFDPIFDAQETSSIGDIAIAPSDPQVLYVGTGEPNNRQSSSWGHGVYRTTDGGRTFVHLGLADTHHIGRVVVHPRDAEVAYVAALGQLWGPSRERGLFRTTDGGRTWTNVKFVDEDTGFVDVALDPESPRTIYAASYQRRRTPFGFNGGGPGSALWKSIDGGDTWRRLGGGLPAEGDVGRIGIAVYARDPRILYALVEHASKGGLYRSSDRGETWVRASETNPRPSYYSKVHVDPSNDQRVWVLGAPLYYSEDGGKTFKSDVAQKIHGDYHAFWIDPADSGHMLVGTDGGIHITYDRGRTWDYVNTLPLAQLYEVHYDMQRPYRVCGGLQDNGSWCGPSRTTATQGIANDDWFRVGGGDGFFTVIDPSDPRTVYVESQDGNLQRVDLRTNERRAIRPEPPAPAPGASPERYRFNWNSPVLLSPHDPRTIYYGGNRLFAARDRGDTWTAVSPDLSSAAARDTLPIFGKLAKDMLSRNDGVVHYGTITAVAESPLRAGVLWVGTDDGNLHVTRDGGATWSGLTVAGVPTGTYVSRVEASRTGEGTAYVAFDGHRGADWSPYVFRTRDFGRTWQALAGGIPRGSTVSVVREHPAQPRLLFAGTERGLYVSFDAGATWQRGKANLPTVPVDDIQVHPRENDLILGTHGRGVAILDDLTPLTEAASTGPQLYPIRTAIAYRMYGHRGSTGHKTHLAPNPPEGALVTWRLDAALPEGQEAQVTVKDGAGRVVRKLKGTGTRGFNRVGWDLREEPPVAPGGPGEGGPGGGPRGPLVVPGRYTVALAAGGVERSQQVVVEDDPRIQAEGKGREAWAAASRRTAALWGQADRAQKSVAALRKELQALEDAKRPLPEAAAAAVKDLKARADALSRRLARDSPMGFAGAPLFDDPDPLVARARSLYNGVSSVTAAPTTQQAALIESLAASIEAAAREAAALVEVDVPALNRTLLENGLGRIDVPPPPARP